MSAGPTSEQDREFDVALVGATGYVGRLTAQRLVEAAPANTRIALVGRSRDRLEALRAGLTEGARDWPLVVLDVSDDSGLAQLASNTRVLVTTVGPYLRRGLPVVQACAAAGTDYADLTGETLFVRRSIEQAALAERTGARIVHSCGFDSIPSDLGVGLNAARAAADGAGELTDTVLHVRSMRGGLSGGTVDSLRQQLIEVAGDRALRAVISSPTALTGPDARPVAGTSVRSRRRQIRRDAHTGRWQAPFAMGGYNRQIVLRTGALADPPYGDRFRYHEVIDTGVGPVGAVGAAAILAGTTALMGGMSFAATRRLLDRVLPEPGQGPSERTRRNGRFVVDVVSATSSDARYRTRIAADHDPGYDGTAVMLSESALALSEDRTAGQRGGVLTPMLALGAHLAERLRRRGFTIATDRLD